MKTDNLYRVEVYRFFHSMSIVKYMIVVPLALFSMSYINIAYMDDEITGSAVWVSMSSVFLYLIAFICAIIGIYVGREFRQKTIYYEVMRGYHFYKIAVSKTITCGLFMPIMIVMCMMGYLLMFPVAICIDFWLRILCMLVFFFYICSCTTLYVLLCRNSVLGGCLAFSRFFILEEVLLNLMSGQVKTVIMNHMVTYQWYRLIDVEAPLTKEILIHILFAAIVEYGILQGILLWQYRKSDI